MNMTLTQAPGAATAPIDPRWAAVLARDADADGRFVYSVRTTGVYCRPSCAARTPRAENVAFHDSPALAEQAGFRPCKRCRPDAAVSPSRQRTAVVADLCRLIEGADNPPTLDELARRAGLSPWHLQRVFKQATGLSPRDYAAAHRASRVREALRGEGTVTRAIYDAGFQSSSRFYADSNVLLGMTPRAYKAGGESTEIRFAIGQCSLGAILVAASDLGVCAVALGDDPERLAQELQDRFKRARLIGGDPDFEALVARVVGFVEAPRQGLDLPLDVRGTVFQQRVWQALRHVPPGETVTYGEIAKRIGAPAAVRAVASACAANPLAVAIPCHRVVRRDGSVSGYRWGVERKRRLLEREATP